MEFELTDEKIKEVKARMGRVPKGATMFSMHIYDEQRAIAHEAQKELVKHLREYHHHFHKFKVNTDFMGILLHEEEWQSFLEHFELEGE